MTVGQLSPLLKSLCAVTPRLSSRATSESLKSFVFRAGRKVPKMGIATRYRFRFGQGHFEAIFNFYFNSRRDALERVAILFLRLRHDARNAPSCFKSSPENMKPQKAGRMTQTSTC